MHESPTASASGCKSERVEISSHLVRRPVAEAIPRNTGKMALVKVTEEVSLEASLKTKIMIYYGFSDIIIVVLPSFSVYLLPP